MKHTRFLFAFAAMLLSASTIWAYDFSAVNNGVTIYYNITSNTAPYTVGVTYRNTNYNSYSGSIAIPTSVSYNGITYSVTSIGDTAFYRCASLTSVTLPNSVTSIGNYAFYGCRGLTSITIPNSVKSIGNNAFTGCTSLRRTNYTGTIDQWCGIIFGDDNVWDYYNANPISVSHNLYINNSLVTNLVIPNTVDTIKRFAFYGDTAITSVTIPNSVKSIGYEAFYHCDNLQQTNYTGTIAQWCRIDFYDQLANPVNQSHNLYINNSLITNLVIPNTVDTIKRYAFYGDTAITSVTIPNSVSSIEGSAFAHCTGLRRTNYTGTIAQWCNIDFGGAEATPVYYSKNLYINNSLLTNLVIPNTIDTIKRYAFFGNAAITSVTIPNSVRSIRGYAFSNCSGFTSITIPNSVTSIENGAFRFCTGLISVIIPNSVSIINSHVFSNCTSLTNVSIGNSVDTISFNAFQYDSALTSITFYKSNTKIHTNGFYGVPTSVTVNVPCGTTSWYRNRLSGFSNFIEFVSYVYSIAPQDTIKGSVATITAPTCNNAITWTIRATANSGYLFSHWSDGDTNAQRTITLTQDTSLIAYFTASSPQQWYNFIVISEDTNKGTVQIVTQPTQANPQAIIAAHPKTGYTFTRWSDGNIQNPRLLTVTQDTLLTAYFSPNTYNVIVLSNDTTKGSVSGSGRFAYLAQDTIVATANYGYSFSHWSDGDNTNPRIITITQDTSFTAFYNFNYYNVSVISNDTAQGSVTGSGRFAYLSQDTLIATPNFGYTFSRWSDGNTTNPRIITITQDTALIAYFTQTTPQPWYNFVVVSEDTNKGTVQIVTQPTQASPQAIIVALPNTGYTFSRWSDGNTQNPRTLTVTQDTVLVACFTSSSQQWYNFVVMSEDTNKGRVQILTQPTQANPQAIIVALPNTGYTFARWSDGNTQNPRTLTVTQDTVLIAFFASNQGIAEAENDNIFVRTVNGHILLEGVSNERVYVSDVLGRVVYHATVNERAEIAVKNRGVYFVKVGNRPAQKVVVIQ